VPSTVKVHGVACRRIQEGSGFVVGPGLVVTNAHVVAASSLVSVQEQGSMDGSVGTVIHFDPINDLAIVRVTELLRVRPLPTISRPRAATAGAVIGFPGGKHKVREMRIGETSDTNRGVVTNQDLPPEFPRLLTGRELTPFRGDTAPGGSGGPLVDGQGRVLGTVALSRPGFGGFAVSNRYVRSALRNLTPGAPAVSTGDCGPTSNDDQRR
jgi:S1-C subfamily serine protease